MAVSRVLVLEAEVVVEIEVIYGSFSPWKLTKIVSDHPAKEVHDRDHKNIE